MSKTPQTASQLIEDALTAVINARAITKLISASTPDYHEDARISAFAAAEQLQQAEALLEASLSSDSAEVES